MPRYVALLRGVSPQNAKMPALKAAFEAAGFGDVRTVLGSGNVVFDARQAHEDVLAARCEQAMQASLGRRFATTVRAQAHLLALLEADPFAGHELPAQAKRVVTFLRDAAAVPALALPIEQDGVQILRRSGGEVFTAYSPHPQGPVFMALLERTFGRDITTRTLDTVRKCAAA